MINTKSLLILFSIFSIVILSLDFSEAAVNVEIDDFENVEVGSIRQVSANISNPNVDKAVALSLISFSSSQEIFKINRYPPDYPGIPETVNINKKEMNLDVNAVLQR